MPRAGRVVVTMAAVASLVTGALGAAPARQAPDVDAVVERVLDLPYQPAHVPTGTDAAFGPRDHPAAFPLTDTTTGTCCAGPVVDQPPPADLAPPFADFPDGFELVELASYDGTPLHAYVADAGADAPGVVVMHGFNTNGKHSVVRYAAMLHANGYTVIAPDHRDMGREWERGGSWHPDGRRGQTLGWKEAEDLLTAVDALADRGVDDIGVLGFSEGAQNSILALARDLDDRIDAVLTFSGPADQATQLQREAAPSAALLTTVVGRPDACGYLADVGALDEVAATPRFILRHDSAVAAIEASDEDRRAVPGLHLYAVDDRLVPPYHATILASRTLAMPAQHTLLVDVGSHAYFVDRWWTQAAALTWFGAFLDPDGAATTTAPTVARTPGGQPLRDHLQDLSGTTRADGDAELDPLTCPASPVPVGPTALVSVTSDGRDVTVDARRSYSGWDDHELVGWTIDVGDHVRAVEGDDLSEAIVEHRYRRPGTHRIRVSVVDDTGRQRTWTDTVEVGRPGPRPRPTPPRRPGP